MREKKERKIVDAARNAASWDNSSQRRRRIYQVTLQFDT